MQRIQLDLSHLDELQRHPQGDHPLPSRDPAIVPPDRIHRLFGFVELARVAD